MNDKEENVITEIVDKVEKLKTMGLDMNTIKRLLIENFKILERFPPTIGECGTQYEVLQVAESGIKLAKLKELKDIKPYGSVGFGEKRIKCQYFIAENDCYIKHMDYFSAPIKYEEGDFGVDLNTLCEKYIGKNRPRKFVYADAWGEIIAQRKAWIKITNFVFACDNIHKMKVRDLITSLQESYHLTYLRKYDLVSSNFERFWEDLVNDYCKIAKKTLSDKEQWEMYMDGLKKICMIILKPQNLKQGIENCKEIMMMWSLEQDIVPAVMNKKGFPMFFDDVIREVYQMKAGGKNEVS